MTVSKLPGAAPVRRARLQLRNKLGLYPRVFLPLARLKRPQDIVDNDTEIVIEGFPRSANSFAVDAFLTAQDRDVRIAHHLHVPAQVMEAARLGIPTIVLIREPESAVASYLVMEPCLSSRDALTQYVRFYESVLPYRNDFVVATFHAVTTDFGDVVKQVNRRFGTGFAPFNHDRQSEREVFQGLEKQATGNPTKVPDERRVARPSSVRTPLLHAQMIKLRHADLAGIRARARDLHSRLVESSSTS